MKEENKEISAPNFMLLRQKNNKGPLYKTTICKRTLRILDEKILTSMPEGWSVQDFYTLFHKGRRFFGNIHNKTVENTKDHIIQ